MRVAAHDETGQVRFVGAAPGRAISSGASASASPRDAARAFLGHHGKSFGVSDQAAELRVESSHAAGEGRRGTYKVTLVLRDAGGGKRSLTKMLRVR